MTDAGRTLSRAGRVWIRNAVAEEELGEIDRVCSTGIAPGVRLIFSVLSKVLRPVDRLAAQVLPGARPVRVVAFNKSEVSNWSLPWHQDRVIAVQGRADVPGFRNWTRKSGVWHVEPPIDLLQRMIFARLHLDAATTENGCMEIACGSHVFGKVAEEDAETVATRTGLTIESCTANRGDVLFAQALTLHRSRASHSCGERRAVRIDYAAESLAPPLEWEFST